MDYEKGRIKKNFLPIKFGGKPPKNRRIPNKIENELEKLYQEASHNYRAFMDTEKGLNVRKKGRKF